MERDKPAKPTKALRRYERQGQQIGHKKHDHHDQEVPREYVAEKPERERDEACKISNEL